MLTKENMELLTDVKEGIHTLEKFIRTIIGRKGKLRCGIFGKFAEIDELTHRLCCSIAESSEQEPSQEESEISIEDMAKLLGIKESADILFAALDPIGIDYCDDALGDIEHVYDLIYNLCPHESMKKYEFGGFHKCPVFQIANAKGLSNEEKARMILKWENPDSKADRSKR